MGRLRTQEDKLELSNMFPPGFSAGYLVGDVMKTTVTAR